MRYEIATCHYDAGDKSRQTEIVKAWLLGIEDATKNRGGTPFQWLQSQSTSHMGQIIVAHTCILSFPEAKK